MKIKKITDSIIWVTKRPTLVGHVIKLISLKYKNLFTKQTVNRDLEKWCESLLVNKNQLLTELAAQVNATNVRELYKDYFDYADAAATDCPITMGGGGDMNLIYWCAEAIHAKHVVETGVAYGWSSLALLLSLKNRPGSKLISIDAPYLNYDESFIGCVVPDNLKANWTILKKLDKKGIPQALEQFDSVDLCHYDSDKSYSGRLFALSITLASTKKGWNFYF